MDCYSSHNYKWLHRHKKEAMEITYEGWVWEDDLHSEVTIRERVSAFGKNQGFFFIFFGFNEN